MDHFAIRLSVLKGVLHKRVRWILRSSKANFSRSLSYTEASLFFLCVSKSSTNVEHTNEQIPRSV